MSKIENLQQEMPKSGIVEIIQYIPAITLIKIRHKLYT